MSQDHDYPLVLVRWRDAQTVFSGRLDFAEIRDMMPDQIETVGFLVYYDEQKLTLANGLVNHEYAQDGTVIPTGWIDAVIPLSFGEWAGKDRIVSFQTLRCEERDVGGCNCGFDICDCEVKGGVVNVPPGCACGKVA